MTTIEARAYTHSLEGAITGMAEAEAELGTISGYTIYIMRWLSEKADNGYIRTEATAWLSDNADEIAMIDEKGGEA